MDLANDDNTAANHRSSWIENAYNKLSQFAPWLQTWTAANRRVLALRLDNIPFRSGQRLNCPVSIALLLKSVPSSVCFDFSVVLGDQLSLVDMSELIRHVIGRLTGRTAKNKYPVAHIEGADNVMLDSSVLCCPVCYNLFDCAPSVLQCGHTFCAKCLRNIAGLRTISRQGDGRSFPCPMCRQPCFFENVAKNYIIEDILNRLEKLPEEEEFRDKLILANLRIAVGMRFITNRDIFK
ncbi:unnamed protein product [Angiostrongylus costaricensis]|uniref:RING-type domain-containing protein n=1 Tax=Angiostrongylus costaricensis TaxID=334426 RepID=A0A0R3P9R0_ANGCS|nr:unnamed protein product [Angiostrongylus costaricensis]